MAGALGAQLFISGALGKNMGLTVNSVKRQDGERVYSIE